MILSIQFLYDVKKNLQPYFNHIKSFSFVFMTSSLKLPWSESW